MEQNILNCIKYYAVQGKALTIHELLLYLTVKTTANRLQITLDQLITQGELVQSDEKYTLALYTQNLVHSAQRASSTKEKLLRTSGFLKILKKIPWVECVYLTGSCGISNAVADDDIDLMIITSEKRLFLTRLVVLFLATCMGVRRRRGVTVDPNTICINLWLDISDLSVPPMKRSLYAAREIAQMQILHQRNKDTFDLFMYKNRWIEGFLPNFYTNHAVKRTTSCMPNKKSIEILDFIEILVKKLQLKYIKTHQTTELITETQLWFHPLNRSKLY